MTEHITDQPDLLTISEAAEVLRAPVATLRYWRHLGTGPHSFRLGRRVLYRVAPMTSKPRSRPSASMSSIASYGKSPSSMST